MEISVSYIKLHCKGKLQLQGRSPRIFGNREEQMKKTKALTILEYCLIIILVIAVVLLMQIYVRRALVGKWKSAADTIGFGRQWAW